MKYPQFVWIVAAIGLLVGCQSVKEQRISAHKEIWSKLSEEDRHRLMQRQLRVGDTEEMVRIALGPPDKILPITRPDGQQQTRWFYDVLESYGDQHEYDPDAMTHFSDREQNVIFQDGSVVEQSGMDEWGITARVLKSRVELSAERRVTSLDLLVTLTPEQKVNAHDIFLKANEELDHFSWDDWGPKGMPIRKKMRADIRAVLTAEQQAKYDATPQYMGGGSTEKR